MSNHIQPLNQAQGYLIQINKSTYIGYDTTSNSVTTI